MKKQSLTRKLIHTLLLFAAAMLMPLSATAIQGECGTGKITSVYTGGWNSDDVIVSFEADPGKEAPNAFHGTSVLRFDSNLSDKRQKAIYAAALLALTHGHRVRFYSHTADDTKPGGYDCSRMTEIRVYHGRV